MEDREWRKKYFANYKFKEDEYLTAEYKLVCKNCGENRYFQRGRFIVVCLCGCEAKKYREEAEREKRYNEIETTRKACLPDESLRRMILKNDDGKTPELTAVIERYLYNYDRTKRMGMGLLLWGEVGTGKTFYAMTIANARIDKGESVLYTTLGEIVEELYSSRTRMEKLNSMLSNDLIVIDDLGVEAENKIANELLSRFVNLCYVRNKVMLITTNLTPKILEEASKSSADVVHARIYSRLLERCYAIKVNAYQRRDGKAKRYVDFLEKEMQF